MESSQTESMQQQQQQQQRQMETLEQANLEIDRLRKLNEKLTGEIEGKNEEAILS